MTKALKGLLSYALANLDCILSQMHVNYTLEEKIGFVSNSLITSINDFFEYPKPDLNPNASTEKLISLFEERIKIKDYEPDEFRHQNKMNFVSLLLIEVILKLNILLKNCDKEELTRVGEEISKIEKYQDWYLCDKSIDNRIRFIMNDIRHKVQHII